MPELFSGREIHWEGLGSSQGGRYWGDRGDWSMVWSRKKKASEHEHRGQDGARVPNWHDGKVTGNGQGQLHDSVKVSNNQPRF